MRHNLNPRSLVDATLTTSRSLLERTARRVRNENQLRLDRQQESLGPEGLGFLVVVTFGRSGSTVLQAALNSCDGVSIRGENYNAARHLFETYRAITRTADEHGNAGAVETDDPWHGAHVVRPEAALLRMREILVRDVLRPVPGTSICGFKEVRHTISHFDGYADLLEYLLFLDELMPGVRYVINVRDPEVTARSGWWLGDPTALSILEETRSWLRAAHTDLRARLGEGRSVLLEYETWDRNPAELIRALDDLGLRYRPEEIERISGTALTHMENYGLK